METIFLLHYGWNLEGITIRRLYRKKIQPFQDTRFWSKRTKKKYKKKRLNQPEIYLTLFFFDLNRNRGSQSDWQATQVLLTRERYEAIFQALTTLKGETVRCIPNYGAHYYVDLNDKQYTANSFVTIEGQTLIVVDDENFYDNEDLRKKMHLLPEHSKLLIFDRDWEDDYEIRVEHVKNWFLKILAL